MDLLKRNFGTVLKEYALISLGVLCYVTSWSVFLMPHNFVGGGVTGISAIIDPQGHIVDKTSWWEPALLEGEVGLSRSQTFFVRYGDMVGRVAVFLFLLLGAAAIFRPYKKKR